jgi:ribose/xylose/arabinose/galactoside ABC-type transport system permease subunit
MTGRHSDEPDSPDGFGYVFSQVSAAVIGGIILAGVIGAILEMWIGSRLNGTGATFLTIVCIPVAWGIRAVVVRVMR